jgi:hypothetical protein
MQDYRRRQDAKISCKLLVDLPYEIPCHAGPYRYYVPDLR